MKLFLSLVISLSIIAIPFIFFARDNVVPTEKIRVKKEYRNAMDVVKDCVNYASPYLEVLFYQEKDSKLKQIIAGLDQKMQHESYQAKMILMKERSDYEEIQNKLQNQPPLAVFNYFFTKCTTERIPAPSPA